MDYRRRQIDRRAAIRVVRGFGRRLEPHVRAACSALYRFASVVFGRNIHWSRRLRYLTAGLAGFAAAFFVLLIVYTVLLIPFTPSIGEIRKAKSERAALVYSADGVLLTEFKPVNRQWVSLDEIAPEVRMALIATEDHRFYDHRGVDFRRVIGAALRTLGGDRQGASTITQQLARNLYPKQIGRRATLTRKLKELITTFKIETAFSKEEILETYLNTVPFLYDAYGIELAARTYFSVSAADLTIEQAATLVGMLKGTDYYNPVRRPERARERRDLVLKQMVRHGYLQEERYDLVAGSELGIKFQRQPRMRSRAPHFTEQARRWLTRWADRHGYNIYRDSLVVHTTLDSRLQEIADQSVGRWMPVLQAIAEAEWSRSDVRLISRSPMAYAGYRRGQPSFSHLWEGRPELVRAFIRATPQYRAGVAAGTEEDAMIDSLRADASFMAALRELKSRLEMGFVAMQPRTGHVLAWIGSRNYDEVPYDHVAVARRQPGSTFKPIVYAAALENGFRPEDKLPDSRVEIVLRNGHIWSPVNAAGTYSEREMSLADGLAYSKNTITAQLIDRVGAGNVARTAARMGIRRSRLDEVPSLALGTSEVTLLEMVNAYATLANAGMYREPVVIERIEDGRGRVIYEARPTQRRALKEENALRIIDMMRGVLDRGTGQRIRSTFGIREDLAGKTGTTQGNADGWFVSMHPELVAGAWVGFSDPRISFRTDYWGAGGNNALLLVGEFYRSAVRHPDTRLVGIRFPDAPEYVERESLWQHVRGWTSDAAQWTGSALAASAGWVRDLFRDSPDDNDPDDGPAPRRAALPAQFGDDDEALFAEADSIAQIQRDSVGIQRFLDRLGTVTDTVLARPLIVEPRSRLPGSRAGEDPSEGPAAGAPPDEVDPVESTDSRPEPETQDVP